MQSRTSQSIKQVDSDTPIQDVVETNKFMISARRAQSLKAFISPVKTKQIIPAYDIEANPLTEYNPRKSLARSMTFDQVQDEELTRFKAEWHWNFFFEFLVYHLLYYVLFGPFVIIFFFKYPGYKLMRNMKFINHHFQFYFQIVLWIGSVFGGLMYFVEDSSVITLTEIIFMWFAISIRSVVISAKYATLSEERIRLYKTAELPEEMFQFDLMLFDWYKQTSKVLFLEQHRALRRHEQENSLYKFDFLVEPNEKTKQQIKETQICFYIEWARKQQTLKQTDPLIEEGIYNGFHLFGYIVNKYQITHPPFDKYIVALSFFFAITPALMRINKFIVHPPGTLDIIRLLLNITTSFFGFFGSFLFLAIGIYDFRRKFFILDQCLYMLQAKKVTYSSSKKLLPTINFNNPMTLQGWSILRSLAFDYGQTYNLRTQGFYSLVFIANIILMFIALGLILDLFSIDMFDLMLLGEMALILIGYTSYYLYLGAGLNEYFDEFTTVLDDVKSIYLDIQRMKEQYFQNNIQPINEVHKIFVGILKDQVGVNVQEIQEYIDIIIDEIDNCMRRVNYDQRNNPFKLYGVVITFNLLKSVIVGISTVFSYAIQQRLQQ